MRILVLVLVALLGVSTSARADWYGEQTLGTDALAVGTLYAGMSTDTEVGAAVGIIGGLAIYAAGPPLVHLAHGERNRAALSLGTRILLPAIGGAIGSRYDDDDCDDAFHLCDMGAMLGVVVGWLGTVIVDAVMARHESSHDAVMFQVGGAL